ncbi:4-hydroxybenzoate transporter [Pandoraea communis]|uniref:4-hydroxybenzoate transporter n=2 Tax=Pandoraea communis TaxID=2508297 RepID=A0A5E4URI4_9BURK|nr:4-hydroxybenzoate transporter [Pandoraea communis]
MAVDGFDTAAISYVAPTLATQWQVPASALAPTFIMTSVGAMLGYLASGPAVTRFGRHAVVVAAIGSFALLSLATALTGSVGEMAVLRLLTAFFLGVVVPAVIAGASGAVTPAQRASVTALVTMGMSVGAAIGGGAAAFLISKFGWESVFLTGGVLPLLLLPAVIRTLRDDDRSEAIGESEPNDEARRPALVVPSAKALLRAPYLASTLLIWAFACLGFLAAYALLFWMPTFLVSFGFEASKSALGTMAVSAGGVLGSLLLIVSVKRVGAERVLMALLGMGLIGFGVLGSATLSGAAGVLLLSACVGAATGTMCVGQAVLAVRTYPLALRTTGVGCTAAAGRLGSIAGPGAVGLLLSLGFGARDILLGGIVPILMMIGLLFVMQRVAARATLAFDS